MLLFRLLLLCYSYELFIAKNVIAILILQLLNTR